MRKFEFICLSEKDASKAFNFLSENFIKLQQEYGNDGKVSQIGRKIKVVLE